jgi:hypothetical protein
VPREVVVAVPLMVRPVLGILVRPRVFVLVMNNSHGLCDVLAFEFFMFGGLTSSAVWEFTTFGPFLGELLSPCVLLQQPGGVVNNTCGMLAWSLAATPRRVTNELGLWGDGDFRSGVCVASLTVLSATGPLLQNLIPWSIANEIGTHGLVFVRFLAFHATSVSVRVPVHHFPFPFLKSCVRQELNPGPPSPFLCLHWLSV